MNSIDTSEVTTNQEEPAFFFWYQTLEKTMGPGCLVWEERYV